MARQRQLFRVAIDRTGTVRRGDASFPCRIADLTEKGVRLEVNGAFGVGEELQLEFALTDADMLECRIQVTYSRPPYIGAAIVRIPPEMQRHLSSFIEELNALNMSGF